VDAERIREVLTNLIANAIKYTPDEGKIVVSARQQDRMVEVAVQDSGPGISPEDLPRLFKKFGRLEGSFVASAEAGGTGLGLYITKKYVELHGGKIRVESKEGEGSSFTFGLPTTKP